MLGNLGGVEGFIRHAKEIRVILLLADDELPEVDGPGDGGGVPVVDAHAVDVAVVGHPPHVLDLGLVSEEAHALQPAVAEGLVDGDDDLVGQELIEDGPQHVHACVLPEAALVVEDFVAHDVRHGSQLVEGTLLVEAEQIHDEVVGQGEGLPGHVLLPPELYLVVRVNEFGFFVKVLFGRRKVFVAEPNLMNDLGNDLILCVLPINSFKLISVIESQHFGKGYFPDDKIMDTFLNFLTLKPCFCFGELGSVQLLPASTLDHEVLADDDCSPGDVPHRGVPLHDVEIAGFDDVCPHHLEQSHQED